MNSKSKGKRKAFYRRCAAGEKKAKQRLLESTTGEPLVECKTPRNLEFGMTGVLVTCNGHEDRLALVESYRLLNEAHERLNRSVIPEIGSDALPLDVTGSESRFGQVASSPIDDDDDVDITTSLLRELADRAIPNSKSSEYIFSGIKTGVSNCLFILNQSLHFSSSQLVHEVFRHVKSSGQSCSRRILRFQPVGGTCRAESADLKNLVRQLWHQFISSPLVTENTEPSSIDPSAVSSPDITKCTQLVSTHSQPLITENKEPSSIDPPAISSSDITKCTQLVSTHSQPLVTENTELSSIDPSAVSSSDITKYTQLVSKHCQKVPPQRISCIPNKEEEHTNGLTDDMSKLKYTINFKARNYDRLSKADAVTAVISAITEVSSDWTPVCANADVVVSVDVFRNVLCLSLLENFFGFAKYNLRELSPLS